MNIYLFTNYFIMFFYKTFTIIIRLKNTSPNFSSLCLSFSFIPGVGVSSASTCLFPLFVLHIFPTTQFQINKYNIIHRFAFLFRLMQSS